MDEPMECPSYRYVWTHLKTHILIIYWAIDDDDDDHDDHDHDHAYDDDKPLNRNGKGGENAPSHASVGERVDQVGEQDCEDAAVRLKFSSLLRWSMMQNYLKGSEGVVESSS